MRRRIQVVFAGIVDEAKKSALRFDLNQLVELSECQVVATAGLVTPRVGQPWLDADALDESGRLPGGLHDRPVCRGRTKPGPGERTADSRKDATYPLSPSVTTPQ